MVCLAIPMVVSTITTEGNHFALAYYREELKAMDCNPDIYAQQKENKDKPTQNKTC